MAAMIMTTVKDRDAAAEMAGFLISERVAACVQEIEIRSHYNWEGRLNSEAEVLLLVKTADDRVDDAIEAIRKKHSYQLPEILVIPAARGLQAYLRWLEAETRPTGK
jgi:periplasmic divalent cation tolerance protein